MKCLVLADITSGVTEWTSICKPGTLSVERERETETETDRQTDRDSDKCRQTGTKTETGETMKRSEKRDELQRRVSSYFSAN